MSYQLCTVIIGARWPVSKPITGLDGVAGFEVHEVHAACGFAEGLGESEALRVLKTFLTQRLGQRISLQRGDVNHDRFAVSPSTGEIIYVDATGCKVGP